MSDNRIIDERIKISTPRIPHTAIWLLLPVEGIGTLVFIAYVAFHFQQFLSQTTALFAWLTWFGSLCLFVGLAYLVVRVIQAAIDALVALGHGSVDVYAKFIEARNTSARRALLHTSDNFIVYQEHGKIIALQVEHSRQHQGQLAGPGNYAALPAPDGDDLPTNVRYEEVRDQVPSGHVLIGVGRSGLETKEFARCGACVWIVGLSGTGKTSTTVLRVEERHAIGHKFLGADPHWFKPDSLTNAIAAYADDFLIPMARTPEEMNAVYHAFLDEFYARRGGKRQKPWQKITLLVDEVGAQMDATTDIEKENAKLLPTIARICGQEARNFEMGGIFVSQQATGLAWLRKMALTVIVHQLLMQSEKELAVNGDKEVVNQMKYWPVGRTYVYGVGFGQDGPLTVQQPYFARPGGAWQFDNGVTVEGSLEDSEEDTEQDTDELPIDEDLREALEAWNNGTHGPRAMQRALGCTYYRAQQLCSELVEKGLVETD